MILVDTSAWVEFLRRTGSAAHLRARELVAGAEAATTDVVLMEVLAGARDELERGDLAGLLGGCQMLPVLGPEDYENAADVHRRCRRGGETIGKLTDCLIAVVAIREGVALLHRDADFDVIARHTALQIASDATPHLDLEAGRPYCCDPGCRDAYAADPQRHATRR